MKIMTLLEFKKRIDLEVKKGHGNLQCFYACDEEGNEHYPVFGVGGKMKYGDCCLDGKGNLFVIN